MTIISSFIHTRKKLIAKTTIEKAREHMNN